MIGLQGVLLVLAFVLAGVGLQGALERRSFADGNEDDAVGEEGGGHERQPDADPLAGTPAQEAVLVGVDTLRLGALALRHAAGRDRRGCLGAPERQQQVDGAGLALGRVRDLVLVLQRPLDLGVEACEAPRVGGGQILALGGAGQLLEGCAVEVAPLEADGEDGGMGALGRALGLIKGRRRDRVLAIAQHDDVGLQVRPVAVEADARADTVPQRRLTRGRQAVDAIEQEVGVGGEVDEHTGLAVEADQGDLVVRLPALHELPGGRLGRVELAVLVHRPRGVDEEHHTNRRVRSTEGNGAEVVDELAVLPEMNVGQVGGRAVQLGGDDDRGELGGVDLADDEVVGERRPRPDRSRGEDEQKGDEKAFQRLPTARLLNPCVANSSAPSLTPRSCSFSANRGRMPVAFRWPLKRPFWSIPMP